MVVETLAGVFDSRESASSVMESPMTSIEKPRNVHLRKNPEQPFTMQRASLSEQ
jgi:hypothetical protein